MKIAPSRWTLAWWLILVETLSVATLFAVSHCLLSRPGAFDPPFGLATLWLAAVIMIFFWALAGPRLLGPLTDATVLLWHVALVLVPVLAFAGGLLAEYAAERAGLASFLSWGRTRTGGVGLLLAANVGLFVPWLALLRGLAQAAGWRRLSYELNWLFTAAAASFDRPAGPRRAGAYGLEGQRGRQRAAVVLLALAILLALLVAYVRAIIERG